MQEKLIEKKLREYVKRLGGIALKFHSGSFTGMPDRIILMPGGKISFVEVKTTGKNLSPKQRIAFRMLKRLGFDCRMIDTQEKLNQFLNDIEK